MMQGNLSNFNGCAIFKNELYTAVGETERGGIKVTMSLLVGRRLLALVLEELLLLALWLITLPPPVLMLLHLEALFTPLLSSSRVCNFITNFSTFIN